MSSKKSGGKGGGKGRKRCNEPKKEESAFRDSGESSRDGGVAFDPFRSLKEFEEGAKNMADRDWARACNALTQQSKEIVWDIYEMKQEEPCEGCGNQALVYGTLAAIQIQKEERAIQEYARRLIKASSDLQAEREEKKEVVSKSLRIGEELQGRLKRAEEEKAEIEAQRDRYYDGLVAKTEEALKWKEEKAQLLATIAEKEERLIAAVEAKEEAEREGRTIPPLPQEEEPMDVETTGGGSPPPLSRKKE